MHLLIFSGGKTEADARRALESFDRLKTVLGRAVVLAKEHPRIVESSKLPGLTGGFWVVILGSCLAPAEALAAIKAVYPGAYSKQLSEGRRYAVVAIFAAAAILTPPDALSMVIMALPTIALYEASIFAVRWVEKKRVPAEAAAG